MINVKLFYALTIYESKGTLNMPSINRWKQLINGLNEESIPKHVELRLKVIPKVSGNITLLKASFKHKLPKHTLKKWKYVIVVNIIDNNNYDMSSYNSVYNILQDRNSVKNLKEFYPWFASVSTNHLYKIKISAKSKLKIPKKCLID